MLENDAVFKPGQHVVLFLMVISARHAIEFFRRQHGRCVAKLRGIDTISEAERYIGSEIRIPADTLPAAADGSFYTFQLKGCGVFALDGEYIGTVTDVLGAGGAQILKVDRENEETLIPFAQSYLRKIDLDQRRIEVNLPEGLQDLNK